MSSIQRIEMVPLEELKASNKNFRVHSPAQIEQIARSILAFGFLVPLVTDGHRTILAGYGRFKAAQKIKLPAVPVIKAQDLSKARQRAFAIADNKIAQESGWDREALAVELPEIADLLLDEDLDISITGFAPAEIEQISIDQKQRGDPLDENISQHLEDHITSRPNDHWQLGCHEILCGDSLDQDAIEALMATRRATMAFLDPAVALRKLERSRDFVAFLESALGAAAAISGEGALHFVCVNWRDVADLIDAASSAYDRVLNLAVWIKSSAAKDRFYRNQHELVGVFRVGQIQPSGNAQQKNNVRNRSNVWRHPGGDTCVKGLNPSPPVKPIALIADAIKDCTRRNDVIFDSFAGCGTTLLAAERTERCAVALENDPRLVDLAVRRWQAFTGKDAVCARSGRSFDKIANDRRAQKKGEL